MPVPVAGRRNNRPAHPLPGRLPPPPDPNRSPTPAKTATSRTSTDDYEYVPLRLPPDVTRVTASMRLAIQAEYGGWELSRVRAYTDRSR
uniref:DUF5703 family protein n=1 Tax=Nocardia cyriacigeorgica TaxID=135487 RepID=UPI003CC7CB42